MPHTPATDTPKIENVIPDCCNIGVMFRVLLVVNAVVLTATIAHGTGLLAFLDASVLTEPACLTSLLALCGLRRVVRTIAPWAQRALCALVPAAVTACFIRFISAEPIAQSDLTILTMYQGMWIAAGFGALAQHYFELRTRAFSPALAEARLQALQARIRPHFLFNSLNAVLSLIRTEPRQAETTLEDLADLFRVLMRDTRDVTSLEEEIRLCRQYLSIEKVRLGERLQVQWKAVNISDKVLRKARVPSLLLQPILENAVHYGVEPTVHPVLIEIEVTRKSDSIEILVVNPLPSSDETAHANKVGNHMALQNIRERLALLYDVEAQLSISAKNGRFEVLMHFPYVRGD
ncbi:MAG TPA: histidine kinase [Burkholderiaceae bacterium]|nr:histidine kinase [Burkholderiaceae bacterium]